MAAWKIATVISYRPRSAVRDVGKALGYSLEEVDVLAKNLENYNECEKLAGRLRESGFNPRTQRARQLNALVQQVLGFPRHLSQHVGGMVLTHKPLCEIVPIENASMPGRTVIEWDKDDLDDLGILKVDCLALGMLTAIRKGFDLIEKHRGRKLTLATIPAEDPEVYRMVQRGDTMGVFQIESRAQMAMLPRLRPACFYDLVIEVAIVRPGPIQGDMVHPYLRRRCGEEAVEFPDERIRSVLEKTLGVPLFQEQAMKLAMIAGGFTPGEADQLRRAMGAWRKTGGDRFRDKLLTGMAQNGYSMISPSAAVQPDPAASAKYGFPELHAASSALVGLARRPGSSTTSRPSSRPPCSTASRWVFTPPPSSSPTPATTASKSARLMSITVNGTRDAGRSLDHYDVSPHPQPQPLSRGARGEGEEEERVLAISLPSPLFLPSPLAGEGSGVRGTRRQYLWPCASASAW